MKVFKDETDESELPTRALGVVCVLVAVILFRVYLVGL
jgi:hypothetical protein